MNSDYKQYLEWWEQYSETLDDSTEEEVAYDAWKECKRQVLKILKNNSRKLSNFMLEEYGSNNLTFDLDYIKKDAIKEIKKL
jgi:hypothetical protein